jgi:Fe-S-cluster containining protein
MATSSIKEFNCLRCGECCNDFVSDKNKDKPTGVFDSKLTICLNKTFLVLYDWEVADFLNELRLIGSNRKVIPTIVSFDLISNRTIVIQYTLDGQNCPFYTNKGCLIYDKRPIVCRQFPCLQDISGIITGNPIGLSRNALCKFEKEDEFPYNIDISSMSAKDYLVMLKQRYGESFFYQFGYNKLLLHSFPFPE